MEINADLVKMARLVLKNYQSAIAEATSPYGLTPLEGLLITFYFVNPSQDTPSSAVKALHVSKGNVSTSLASLLQRGFLEKRNDAKDHRTSHLRLTEKSQTALHGHYEGEKRLLRPFIKGPIARRAISIGERHRHSLEEHRP